MSKLILGTVQFGLNYGINNFKGKLNAKEIKKTLDVAYKNEIRTLDTAEIYGDSHERIGEYHKKNQKTFKIISKYSSLRNDLPKNIIDRVAKNLTILNSKMLYCYMFHNFNDYKCLFELFRGDLLYLKRNGLIHKLGVSLHSNEEITEVMKNDDIDLIQLPFNLLDNSNERAGILKKAKKKGIEIHTRSVFLQGLFFKEPSKLEGNLKVLRDDLRKINKLVSSENISDLALNYAYSKDYIDSVLIGVDSVDQLKANIVCVENNACRHIHSKIDEIVVKNSFMLNPSNWKV
tara:strand:- start:14941 stop:15810 length:870 start_codon:yes stop_codon:yes gene_type:complete